MPCLCALLFDIIYFLCLTTTQGEAFSNVLHTSEFINDGDSVSSEDISSCLAQNASLPIFITRNLSITYNQKRTLLLNNTTGTVRTCKLKIITEPTQTFQVELLYQTCTPGEETAAMHQGPALPAWRSSNLLHFVHTFYIPPRYPASVLSSRLKLEEFSQTELWTGCESVRDPLRRVVSRLNSTVLTLTVGHLHEQYSVRLAVSVTKPPPRGPWPARLHTSFVTSSMGRA